MLMVAPHLDCRAGWTLPLLISNITLDMRSFLFTWNVPVQMQFFLLLPLVILLLRPQRLFIRRRIAWACVLAIVMALMYRTIVVLAFNFQASLPVGAHTHAASHHPASVAAAWNIMIWLHASFMSRMTDFALGMFIYLILSSPKACAAIRSRPWVCTAVSAVAAAFTVSTCTGEMDIRPRPLQIDSMAARMGVHVAACGIAIPFTTAWLILYSLVDPDAPSRWAAAVLGSPKWSWLAARTYSVFLLHPFVMFGLFQAIPVVSCIGQLENLSTYTIVTGLVLAISFGLAWVQDVTLDLIVSKAQNISIGVKAAKASRFNSTDTCATCLGGKVAAAA